MPLTTHPSEHMPDSYYGTMHKEIERVASLSELEPPKIKEPVELGLLRDELADHPNVQCPTTEQQANFLEDIKNDFGDIVVTLQQASPGMKFYIVPVVSPNPKGAAVIDDYDLKFTGGLEYFVVNQDMCTVRANNVMYLDAVLPHEVLENRVEISRAAFLHPQRPEEIQTQLEAQSNVFAQLKSRIASVADLLFPN